MRGTLNLEQELSNGEYREVISKVCQISPRKTTEMTKRLPTSPTLNTRVYAMQYIIDIVELCRNRL